MKKVLSIILVMALLAGNMVPASAGMQATYPPGETQFANQDGWKLMSFEANGPSRYSALGWVNLPTIVSLETIWERNGETVTHETGDQVIVAPGTFTWAIEDGSIAQLVPAQELPPDIDLPPDYYTDGTHALFFCLREGKTVITVTGPQGKVSKCGLTVMPEETGENIPSDNGYTNDEIFTEDDGWAITNFYLHLNREALNQEMGVGETGTLQIHSSWWRQTDPLVPETVSGYLNLAPEAFTWSVSDETVAVLCDDYPGTTARSLVALAEGYVTVTVTGPLGKYFTKQIYVLPIDEFSGGGGPDGPTPPDFDDPRPWRFDVGGFVVELLLRMLRFLFRPLIRVIAGIGDEGEGEEWLNKQTDRLKAWIYKALRPVQWVVDGVMWAVDMAAQAVAAAPSFTEQILNWLINVVLLNLLKWMMGSYLELFFPGLFSKKMTLSSNGFAMLKSWENGEDWVFLATPTYLTVNGVRERYPTIGWGHYMSDGKNYVVIDGKQYTQLTEDLANRLFIQDKVIFDTELNKFLKNNNLTLTQKRYDACYIDMYQKGTGDWPNSPAANYVARGNYTSYNNCVEAFCLRADGRTPANWGHERRRTAEAILFFNGIYQMNEPGFAPHRYF